MRDSQRRLTGVHGHQLVGTTGEPLGELPGGAADLQHPLVVGTPQAGLHEIEPAPFVEAVVEAPRVILAVGEHGLEGLRHQIAGPAG